MKIDCVEGEYIVSCKFEERFLPKNAGFQWDPARKKWVTTNRGVAMTFGPDVLTDRAKAAFGLSGALPVPEGLAYLPFQEEGIRFAQARPRSLIADQPGLGKGHPITTRVLTVSGWKPIGALKLYERIIGADGKPYRVTGLFDRGMLPIYTVTFTDGASVQVDGDHLWSVTDCFGVRQTMDTLVLAARVDEGWAVPTMTAPAQVEPNLRTPYRLIAGTDLATTHGRGGGRRVRPVYPENLYDASRLDEYAEGAPGQIMDFLQGVFTSIAVVRNGALQVDFRASPIGGTLASTVVRAVQRLGGIAHRARIWRRHRLTIHLPADIKVWGPCLGLRAVPRGLGRWASFEPGVPPRTITSITAAGRDQVRCISVEAPDRLYVTEHCIVTHNTIQGVGLMNTKPTLKNALIISPSSLKRNWLREVQKWCVHKHLSVDVVDGSKFPKSDITIINYDVLGRHRAALREREWEVVIPDEHHYCKNPDSGRTKELHGGVFVEKDGPRRIKNRIEPIPAGQIVLLTGTPLANRPSDLFTTVRACDPWGLGKDAEQFYRTYCGGYDDMNGFNKDGAPEPGALRILNKLMRERFMIRRLKADVLKDLPPKIRQIVPLPNDGLKKKIEEEKQAVADLLDAFEHMLGLRKEMSHDDMLNAVMAIKPEQWEEYAKSCANGIEPLDMPLTRLANARQDLAVAKLPMVREYVRNLVDQGEKVVVFGYHQAVIEGLLETFGDMAACIYGKTPQKRRQEQQDRFQTDPHCRVFIGQYTAAGTGWTLTQSCHFVSAELTWVPHELLQAEDRVHRIGSEIWDTVWAHHLVVEESMDFNMLGKLVAKMDVISLALD